MRKSNGLLVVFVVAFIFCAVNGWALEENCLGCHERLSPMVVEQWRDSAHGKEDVGCTLCHDPEITQTIISDRCEEKVAVVVSPNVCANCHEEEVEEQEKTKHATTLHFFVNFLKDGWTVKGANSDPERATGCYPCHGSIIKDELNWINWPNNGVGRLNPDNSFGTCTVCHSHHRFSLKEARNPTTCGRCHLGPDHPQIEVWEESKHGKLFAAGEKWAPSCYTCHMGPIKDNSTGKEISPSTHDIGNRLYWEIQAPLSTPFKDKIFFKPNLQVAKSNRERMRAVCLQCHVTRHADAHFEKFDKVVTDYSDNYFKPAKKLYDELKQKGLLSPRPFDDKADWLFWYLWHHEGRRMRIGAAMMGADYAWWHGAHDAKIRYMELWEEYQRLIELGKPDPVPYLPGAVFEKGPNLRPGIDVPDLRKLEKKK
ncbi:MAG: hydroxylamine oxidoreductase [Deltaproteobacteria bacterium]|nr:hydroxylamine oxidoreductase [Deltaproteobacteria bacterium]